MRPMILLLALAPALAGVANASVQEPASKPGPPAPAAAERGAATAGPDAKTIVERAVAAQRAGKLARDVRDFEVRATLTNKDDKGRITFDVDCRFQAPDKVWTDVTEAALSRKRFVEAYDGSVAWYKDENGVKRYEGRDHLTDRQKLQETSRTMNRLLRFFFLENLIADIEGLQRLEDHSSLDSDGKTVTAYRVTGIGTPSGGDDGSLTRVTLWVDQATNHLLGVRLEPETGEGETLQFCFWYHRPNPQGVVVPGSIEVYHDDEDKPSQRLSLKVKDGRNDIRFNVGLKDELFTPPGK